MTAELGSIQLMVVPGTIDAIDVDATQHLTSPRGRLSAEDLVERVPELGRVAQVRALSTGSVLSHALSDGDWIGLARTIQGALERRGVDAVVVTHGTNNLEETAYFLSLVLRSGKPVVITGAMRPFTALSSDGPANLLNAVRVAADRKSKDRGVVVVFSGSIYSARDVTKMSTQRIEPFGSLDLGPLGFIDSDGSVGYEGISVRSLHRGATFDLSVIERLPKVPVITSYIGADAAIVVGCVASGVEGIVSAGGGGGICTPIETEALEAAVESGIIVCQASRVWGGRVVVNAARQASGFIAAGNLNPWKARILLQLALTQTKDRDEIQELFDRL